MLVISVSREYSALVRNADVFWGVFALVLSGYMDRKLVGLTVTSID